MSYKILLLIAVVACASFSCEDGLELVDDTRISNEEFEVLEDCQNESITTIKQIEENLIGKWELVGYACGNCIDGSAPSASIHFQPGGGEYQFDDGFESIDQGFTWRIEETRNLFGETILALSTNPRLPGLAAEVFCRNYMTYNNTPVDGPLLIYAKQ
ncbi:MAG: hypothetical protein AAF705_14805 [Bacteroidota bacterium]